MQRQPPPEGFPLIKLSPMRPSLRPRSLAAALPPVLALFVALAAGCTDGMSRIDEIYGIKVNSEVERVDKVRERFPWYFDDTIQQADDEKAKIEYGGSD